MNTKQSNVTATVILSLVGSDIYSSVHCRVPGDLTTSKMHSGTSELEAVSGKKH